MFIITGLFVAEENMKKVAYKENNNTLQNIYTVMGYTYLQSTVP